MSNVTQLDAYLKNCRIAENSSTSYEPVLKDNDVLRFHNCAPEIVHTFQLVRRGGPELIEFKVGLFSGIAINSNDDDTLYPSIRISELGVHWGFSRYGSRGIPGLMHYLTTETCHQYYHGNDYWFFINSDSGIVTLATPSVLDQMSFDLFFINPNPELSEEVFFSFVKRITSKALDLVTTSE